ncbi:MAG: tetratricopeptide repeat protein, partial [Chloroflexota bacterium]
MSFDYGQDFDSESPSWWQRLRGSFSQRERWRNLNWSIAAYPNVAANYVLRGELLLKQGDTPGAIADFRKALDLAMVDVEKEDWGVVAQSVQDRALVGLRDAL